MAVLASPQYQGAKELEPMVEIGPYRGVLGTMWSIARDEGTSQDLSKTVKKGKKTERKGQGIGGLWRGWRVGMWGLAGVWGARAMSGSGNGGQF